jgi:hypothetical protein
MELSKARQSKSTEANCRTAVLDTSGKESSAQKSDVALNSKTLIRKGLI